VSKRAISRLIAAAALSASSAALLGQAAPAVRSGLPPLTAGGYYSNFHSDFTPNRLGGAGVYVDWDLFRQLGRVGRLGVEGEARWLRFNQQEGSYEDNYLVGPRLSRRYGKLVPYAKFLMGAGELEFNSNLGHGGYFALVPGGGLDYRLTHRITLRAIDYEYQFWPSALGGGLPSHGLNPNGFSFGVGYRIF
jgi:opacity protein-like surface antigen